MSGPPKKRTNSFTFRADKGLVRALVCPCQISAAAAVGTVSTGLKTFNGIWDTGATATVITQAVVDGCGLKPTGMAIMETANGAKQSDTYVVDIGLPSGVLFQGVKVCLGDLPSGYHALIGMDIIAAGDFAITSANGKTVFSFRYPSTTEIDFVKETHEENARIARQGRPMTPGQSFHSKKGRKR